MNWKKFFAALLAVCLAVSCLCMNANAVAEDPVDPNKQLEMQQEQNRNQNSDSAPMESPGGGTTGSGDTTGGDTTGGDNTGGGSTGGSTTGGDTTGDDNTGGGSTTGSTGNTGTDPDSSIGGGTTGGDTTGDDNTGGGSTTGSTGNTGTDPDSSIGGGTTGDDNTGGGSTTGNTGTDSDFSIGGGVTDTDGNATTRDATTTEAHGEIANAKADGTWGEEYTTCEKCGKHDWWKLSDGTFVCKNCGFNTTGVKETSNVEVWEGGTDLVVLDAQVETKDTQLGKTVSVVKEITGTSKNAESTGSQSGKDTLSVSISSVGGVDVAGNAEQSAGQTITRTVSVSDIKNLIEVKDSKESQFIRINLEETLSLNPVQAAADKRELAYLNSVLAYQIANAQKEQQYIASVQQQQQAALQREEAYAEMVLAAAAKLQQEADQREVAYLQSVRAAQVAAQKQLMTESELTVKTPSIQKALIVY